MDIDKMYCGIIKRGDIFSCGHKDQERVVVVLQDSVLNRSMPTVICALVEFHDKFEKVLPNEIELDQGNIHNGKKGICMLHKIVTIDRRLIFEKLGELQTEVVNDVYKALDVNLGRFRDR